MASTQTRLSWTAAGMVLAFNLMCWLPASLWAFIIAASTGLVFLLATRAIWIGSGVAAASFVLGILTAKFLPDGYFLYFVGFSLVFVILPSGLMSGGIKQGLPVYRTQLLATLPIVLVMLLYLANVAGSATAWKNVMDNMSATFIEWYEETVSTIPSTASPEEISLLKKAFQSSFDFLYRFFPGLMVSWAVAMNVVSYFFACKMIQRDGGFCQKLREFALWKAGAANMYVLAVALMAWLIGTEGFKPISENVLFVVAVLYMVAGFAVIEHYLKRVRIHPALRIAFYIALLLSGWVGGLVAALIGLADSHFDFRRVKAQTIG